MIPHEHPMRNPSKSSFRRLIEYVLDSQGKEERVENVIIENCIATDPFDAVEEVIATQNLNTRAKSDKTYHFTISFPVGEKPLEEDYKKMVEEYCKALGLQEHQRIIVAHNDTENFHLHVAVNKIHPKTHKICNLHQSQTTLNKVAERLEKEYNLQRVNHTPNKTRAENLADNMESHSGVESFIGYLKRNCAEKIETAQTWADVHKICAENGVVLKISRGGFIFESLTDPKIKTKASSVSRKLSRNNLEKRLGKFISDFSADNPKQTYDKRPFGFSKKPNVLFVQYKQETSVQYKIFIEEKKEKRKKIRKEYGQDISQAYMMLSVLNNATKGKKMTLAAELMKLYFGLCAVEARWKRLEAQKALRKEKYPKTTFVGWLQKEAKNGNTMAVDALLSRQKAGIRREKNIIISKTIVTKFKARAGNFHVSKKGMFVYKNVRMDGENIKIKKSANIEDVQNILRMAGDDPIEIKGDANFVADIVKSSVVTNTPFKDQRLENFRKNNGKQIANGKYRFYQSSIGNAGSGLGTYGNATDRRVTNGLGGSRRDEDGNTNRNVSNITYDKKSYTQRMQKAWTSRKAPPPSRRNVLRQLSECPVVRFPNDRAVLLSNDVSHNVELSRPRREARQRDDLRWATIKQNTSQSKIDAAESYIENRQKNIEKGISDILPHVPFLDHQNYIYQGTRNKNNEKLVLLKYGEEVEVLPIDAELGVEFAAFKIGEPIVVHNQDGKIFIEPKPEQSGGQGVKLSDKQILAKAQAYADRIKTNKNQTDFSRGRK